MAIPQLDRSDLLLVEHEYKVLLEDAISLTLPQHLRRSCIEDLIWEQCNGHIGCIRQSFLAMNDRFGKGQDADDDKIVAFYLSEKALVQIHECFDLSNEAINAAFRVELADLLMRDPNLTTFAVGNCLTPALSALIKLGVFVSHSPGNLLYSSPLAKRYLYSIIFPNRGLSSLFVSRNKYFRVSGTSPVRSCGSPLSRHSLANPLGIRPLIWADGRHDICACINEKCKITLLPHRFSVRSSSSAGSGTWICVFQAAPAHFYLCFRSNI
jgi:hypothetical protein